MKNINRSIVQGSAIGPNSFSVYVADLKALGATNVVCKYADDTTLLVPVVCDVKIEHELANIAYCISLRLLYLLLFVILAVLNK